MRQKNRENEKMVEVRSLNNLEIKVQTPINPTEIKKKVEQAIENIFPDSEYIAEDNKISISSSKLEVLKKIKEQVRSRRTTAVLKRVLYNNYNGNMTWFLLNKQAAFSGIVALVENEDESPLGPIKISIKNYDLEKINEWFEK